MWRGKRLRYDIRLVMMVVDRLMLGVGLLLLGLFRALSREPEIPFPSAV